VWKNGVITLVNSFSLEAIAKKMWEKLESTLRSRDVWPKDMNIKIRTDQEGETTMCTKL